MIEALLRPNRSVRKACRQVHSVLSPEAQGVTYDARAEAYDRVVGSWLYNRLLWDAWVERYHRPNGHSKAGRGPS